MVVLYEEMRHYSSKTSVPGATGLKDFGKKLNGYLAGRGTVEEFAQLIRLEMLSLRAAGTETKLAALEHILTGFLGALHLDGSLGTLVQDSVRKLRPRGFTGDMSDLDALLRIQVEGPAPKHSAAPSVIGVPSIIRATVYEEFYGMLFPDKRGGGYNYDFIIWLVAKHTGADVLTRDDIDDFARNQAERTPDGGWSRAVFAWVGSIIDTTRPFVETYDELVREYQQQMHSGQAERGFLSEEEIAAKVLPPDGVDVWTAGTLDAAGVLFLAKCLLPEAQSTLTSLDIRDNDTGTAGAIALAASLETNSTLTSLDVSDNQFGAAGATALAASLETNATLTSLDIAANEVGVAGATALAASLEVNTTLTSLDIAANEVGDSGASALAVSLEKNGALTSLCIAANEFGIAGATALFASLAKNTTLTSLDISSNEVGIAGIAALAASLEKKNTTLTSFDIGSNEVGAAGAAALASILDTNTTLTSLFVAANQVGDSGATALAASLEKKNTTLTSLDVSANDAGDTGAAALAASLETNTTLVSLDAADNQVGDAGATALAASLGSLTSLSVAANQVCAAGATALAVTLEKNVTLTSLNMYANQVGDAGAIALAASLDTNTTLTSLDVAGNQVGDSGAIALAASLGKNQSLTSLNLAYNQVGDAGAIALAAGLEQNTSLTSLSVNDNQVGDAGAVALAISLEMNMTLTSLNLVARAQASLRTLKGLRGFDYAQHAITAALESSCPPPTWNVTLRSRSGCLSLSTSSSLAFLLNAVVAKQSFRRRSQLRVLDGTSLEPIACGTDDPGLLRDGKCALSAAFGARMLADATVSDATDADPSCSDEGADQAIRTALCAVALDREVHLAVSFGVECVAFVYAIDHLHGRVSSDAKDPPDNVAKRRHGSSERAYVLGHQHTRRKCQATSNAGTGGSTAAAVVSGGSGISGDATSLSATAVCDAIPREVKTLLFSFIRA